MDDDTTNVYTHIAYLSELRFRKEPTFAAPLLAAPPPGRRNVAIRFTLRTLLCRATEPPPPPTSACRLRGAGVLPPALAAATAAPVDVAEAAVPGGATCRRLLRRLRRPSVSPRIIFRRGGRFGAASESEVSCRPEEVASVCEPWVQQIVHYNFHYEKKCF